MLKDRTNVKKHESFALLSFCRQQGNKRALFGSSIVHNNTITLKISHAEDSRDFNCHHYYGYEEIIEVEMSATQFTDAITNMNTEGVPVTLRYLNGETMEQTPFEGKVSQFEDEFSENIKEVLGRTGKLMKMVEEKLKAPGTISKAVRLEMAEHLYHIEQDIRANLPFVHKQFNHQMDKTMTEAKGEIEAFFTSTIHALGSKKLIEDMENGTLKNPLIEEDVCG